MIDNPSRPYGFYGGVAPGDVYIPPPSRKFIPPAKSVSFTKEQLEALLALASMSAFNTFLNSEAKNMLFRTLSATNNGTKTFIINNAELSGSPVVYSSSLSSVVIQILPTPTSTPPPTQTPFQGPPPTPPATETPYPTPTST